MEQLFGIYQAVVVSAADPTGQRRLLVTVPEELGAATLWAPLSGFNSRQGTPPGQSGSALAPGRPNMAVKLTCPEPGNAP